MITILILCVRMFKDGQTPMDDYSRNRDTHTWELKKWWIERIACIMNVPVDEVRLLDEDTEEQQQINKGLPQEVRSCVYAHTYIYIYTYTLYIGPNTYIHMQLNLLIM